LLLKWYRLNLREAPGAFLLHPVHPRTYFPGKAILFSSICTKSRYDIVAKRQKNKLSLASSLVLEYNKTNPIQKAIPHKAQSAQYCPSCPTIQRR
jgi:hypothetical protein